MCRVTVIMPSLNVVRYIRQSLYSVMSQSLDDIEIICVDAGSTDGTIDIIKEYMEKDSRIKLISADKQSYGYQVNRGILDAKGEYIGIVETDDYIDDDMYELLYETAVSLNADMVKGLPYFVYETENNNEVEFPIDYIPHDIESNCAICPDMIPSVHIWDGTLWNGLYKRSFLIENGIRFSETNGAAYQDIGFFQSVLNKAHIISYIRAHFYHYRISRFGSSSTSVKCLKNTRYEYELLFNKEIKEKHKPYVYARCWASFLIETQKTIIYYDCHVENESFQDDMDSFFYMFDSAFRSGKLNPDMIPEENRDTLYRFLNDRGCFLNTYKNNLKKMCYLTDRLLDWIDKDRVLVFGAGNYGKKICRFLIINGIRPDAFVDNNSELYNVAVYGIKIIGPCEAVAKYKRAKYLVAMRRDGLVIKNQLLRLGIDSQSISIIDEEYSEIIKEVSKNMFATRREYRISDL